MPFWPVRRIATTGWPAELSPAAISSAVGRWDHSPAAYRTPRPIARPSNSVIRSENTVVLVVARLAIAYTPTVSHRVVRQSEGPVRPIIVAYAARPAR